MRTLPHKTHQRQAIRLGRLEMDRVGDRKENGTQRPQVEREVERQVGPEHLACTPSRLGREMPG